MGLAALFAENFSIVGIEQKPLLLFFSSARCGSCRRMGSTLALVAQKERRRVRMIEIDVDEHGDLASRFRVDSTPTLVLVRDKRAVCRLEGRVSATRIETLLAEQLPRAVAA